MLVLSRNKDEWVDVNGGVEVGGVSVCIVEIRGDKVRLGFDAPSDIPIHRREVQKAIIRENQRAANAAAQTAPKKEDGE